nr:glycosyltransferase family 4 protein [uncultured Albidiferax sp.]
MKVAHVVRQYLPSIGGMEEVVRNLVQYQHTETDYKPYVVTLDRVFREPNQALPHQETLDGISVHRLSYSGSERYPWCPQVLAAIRDADLVHVHGIDFFFDYLALTRPLHGKPLLASTHGGFFHTAFAQRLKKCYFHSITRLSALAYQRIIATSENDGDIFSNITSAPRLLTIENGVDIQKFDDAASQTLNPTLIYFGRWSVNKGILEALDVLAALSTQQPNTPWKMIIAGREYDIDAQAINAHAHRLGIQQRISIFPGPTNADLRALVAQASYFICLSRHEGFGIAPIEAMSAGLIPVLSAIPPFKRLVDSTGIGLVLDATGPSAQAQQIAELHTRKMQLPAHGVNERAAARDAAGVYSWKGVAARYTQQYDHVIRT